MKIEWKDEDEWAFQGIVWLYGKETCALYQVRQVEGDDESAGCTGWFFDLVISNLIVVSAQGKEEWVGYPSSDEAKKAAEGHLTNGNLPVRTFISVGDTIDKKRKDE